MATPGQCVKTQMMVGGGKTIPAVLVSIPVTARLAAVVRVATVVALTAALRPVHPAVPVLPAAHQAAHRPLRTEAPARPVPPAVRQVPVAA